MFPQNSYIEEKITKQRMHDHVRGAEHDRMAWLASQAADDRAHKRGAQMRRLSWVGRLISAIIGGA